MKIEYRSGERIPVLHRSNVRGIVIAETQNVEVWIDDQLSHVEQHRYWRDWDSQYLHHIDTIKLPQ